ncbi:protein FATTY ACID EXPORT 4, chloroplastic [Punica granatum]|uniref:Uncharacterized protein n=2 Tax=Punica granatum TaxID=22663 RepID=A0A218WIF4_PUNGR|nr:protein FATTY ACID EXPORT 4, chloroplastic [Punica granatum]OWM72259.1 hypothetical protein CDL15_Pgr018144 [Punica granatum]PKI57239.1 hypothetical protein CRG98_022336 [Punica granatum]
MSASSSAFSLALPTAAPSRAAYRRCFTGSPSTRPLSSSGSIAPRNQGLGLNLRLIGQARPAYCSRRPGRFRSQLADFAPPASAVYGTLLLSGGLFAYLRSGSKGSLAGGLTGAALMAAAYYLMQSPEMKAAGDALGFGSAILFCSVFGIRLVATRKLTPAGPLLGLSLAVLAVFVSAYFQDTV